MAIALLAAAACQTVVPPPENLLDDYVAALDHGDAGGAATFWDFDSPLMGEATKQLVHQQIALLATDEVDVAGTTGKVVLYRSGALSDNVGRLKDASYATVELTLEAAAPQKDTVRERMALVLERRSRDDSPRWRIVGVQIGQSVLQRLNRRIREGLLHP